MTWFVLLQFIVFGAFGGILSVISMIEVKVLFFKHERNVSTERAWNACSALASGALGGVGGALAAMFVMSIDGKIDSHTSYHDKKFLTYIGAATIAGYLGFTLLQVVAEKFKKAIQEAREAAKDVAEDEIRKSEAARKDELELLNAISLAYHSLGAEPIPSNLEIAITELKSVLPKNPTHRKVVILLGRCLRHASRLHEAINMFDKALAEKEKKGEGNDKDAADFLYNQACYYCKIAENETEQVAKEQNFQKTLEVLSKSCQISTSNKIDAQKDPDFSSVRDENQGEITLKFKRIVGV